jgi:hypothetical protein
VIRPRATRNPYADDDDEPPRGSKPSIGTIARPDGSHHVNA